jgi:AcrR family transcriptional regulator
MATRMSAEARREEVLAAATRAFGRDGFAGTSTDAVAREAGVSQPYVVRIFGSKLDLFLEVFGRCTDRIKAAFDDVLSAGPFDPGDDDDWARLGLAYTDLVVGHRDVLQVLMHGFAAAGDPRIGAQARRQMGEIFGIVLGTGCTEEQARDFVAQGMLLNVMLAMQAPEHLGEHPEFQSLTECAFGDALALVVAGHPG